MLMFNHSRRYDNWRLNFCKDENYDFPQVEPYAQCGDVSLCIYTALIVCYSTRL